MEKLNGLKVMNTITQRIPISPIFNSIDDLYIYKDEVLEEMKKKSQKNYTEGDGLLRWQPL